MLPTDIIDAEYFRKRPDSPITKAMSHDFDLETAERACEGDITVVNIPWKFPNGKINWQFDPTAQTAAPNPEWVWQLNRMIFWIDLANAYAATGNEKYARAFRDQMRSWVETARPSKNVYCVGSTWRPIETGLRLMVGWSVAFERFRTSPSLSDDDLRLMLCSMREQADFLMKHQSAQNHLLMEMNGVYTFASQFPEFLESEMLRRESAKVLARELAVQTLPDGWQFELTPDYHSVSWSCFSRTYRFAQLCGHVDELPQDFARLLEKQSDVFLGMMNGAMIMPNFNDSFLLNVEDRLAVAAELFPNRKDFLWAGSSRKTGTPPEGESASRLFPYAGYAAMRSDWGPDATYLGFDFGPRGASDFHDHQDKLNFTLWKGDEELVFDDGGGQYELTDFRKYARTAHDHNTMLVDGLGQYRTAPMTSDGPIDCGWKTSPERDEIHGIYDQEFEGDVKPAVQCRSIVFDKVADTVTITDDVTSADGNAHDYTLLFQLDTTDVTIAADRKSLYAKYGEEKRWALRMEFDGADTVTTASGQLEPTLAGWYIGRNNKSNHPATTVFVMTKGRYNHRFTTVLKPQKC